MSSVPTCEHVVESWVQPRPSALASVPGRRARLGRDAAQLLELAIDTDRHIEVLPTAILDSRSSAAAPGKSRSSDEERSRAARDDGEVSASNPPTIPHAELAIRVPHRGRQFSSSSPPCPSRSARASIRSLPLKERTTRLPLSALQQSPRSAH